MRSTFGPVAATARMTAVICPGRVEVEAPGVSPWVNGPSGPSTNETEIRSKSTALFPGRSRPAHLTSASRGVAGSAELGFGELQGAPPIGPRTRGAISGPAAEPCGDGRAQRPTRKRREPPDRGRNDARSLV